MSTVPCENSNLRSPEEIASMLEPKYENGLRTKQWLNAVALLRSRDAEIGQKLIKIVPKEATDAAWIEVCDLVIALTGKSLMSCTSSRKEKGGGV